MDSTRGKQHLKSWIGNPNLQQFGGIAVKNMTGRLRMSVTRYYRKDAMLKQITEAIRINGRTRENLINDKSELNYVSLPRVHVESLITKIRTGSSICCS